MADQEYEDHTVEIEITITEDKRQVNSDEWPRDKHLAPFGQLPYLEITDDSNKTVKISQTDAIARYLARKFHFYGRNEIEMAQCDMYSDLIVDYSSVLVRFIWEPIVETKKLLKKQLIETEIPKIANFFDEKIKTNGTGFIIGNKLTFVDLKFYRTVEGSNNNFLNGQSLYLKHSNIKQWYNMIGSLPKIAERIAERPNYMY